MKNETIIITTETFNKITAYLGTKPFQEVFGLIQEIQNDLSKNNKEETKDKK